jgi:hypothetical protein
MPIVKLKSGLWSGSGTLLTTSGKERSLFVFFLVSEDERKVETAITVYIEGRTLEKGKQYDSMILATPTNIEDNRFSLTHTQGTIYNLLTVKITGRFVSPTLLEGTFESSDGVGKWTATPSDN